MAIVPRLQGQNRGRGETTARQIEVCSRIVSFSIDTPIHRARDSGALALLTRVWLGLCMKQIFEGFLEPGRPHTPNDGSYEVATFLVHGPMFRHANVDDDRFLLAFQKAIFPFGAQSSRPDLDIPWSLIHYAPPPLPTESQDVFHGLGLAMANATSRILPITECGGWSLRKPPFNMTLATPRYNCSSPRYTASLGVEFGDSDG